MKTKSWVVNVIGLFFLLLTAAPASAQSGLVPLYRYVYATNNDHFYTTNAAEIGTTTAGQIGKYNFKSEGIAGYVYPSAQPGTTPLYRYYKAPGHLYTTNANEIGITTVGGTVNGWTYEGIAGYLMTAAAANVVPFYRYVNGAFHFYTTSSAEVGTTTPGATGTAGWTSEGIAGYLTVITPVTLVPPVNTAVPGTTLTGAQMSTLINWIQGETSISTTPFCYKKPGYDRGIGIAPTECANGKQYDGGLCYDSCRAGYGGAGPVCWQSCPSGYSDMGAICHFAGTLSYMQKTVCEHRQSVPYVGSYCDKYGYESCRDGYTSVAGVCWADLHVPPGMSGSAADPMKDSYGRGVGTMPTVCKSDRELQAGLCYLVPRSGYGCTVTACTQNCAAGSSACGVAACANTPANCASNITDMVVSTASMLAAIGAEAVTLGAATPAVEGAKAGAQSAKAAVLAARIKRAQEAIDLAGDLNSKYSEINQVVGAITLFVNVAETNLAGLSTRAVEAQIAARYGRGTANYRAIARNWAAMQMAAFMSDLQLQLETLIITTMDFTGILGTISAFKQPTCTQHTDMPGSGIGFGTGSGSIF